MAASKKGTLSGIYDSNLTELRVGDSVKDLDSGMTGCVDKYRNLVNTAGVKMNPGRCVLTESWIDYEIRHKNQKEERPDMEPAGVSEAFKKSMERVIDSEMAETDKPEPDDRDAMQEIIPDEAPEGQSELLVCGLCDFSDQQLIDELRSRGVEVRARKARSVIVWEEL